MRLSFEYVIEKFVDTDFSFASFVVIPYEIESEASRFAEIDADTVL